MKRSAIGGAVAAWAVPTIESLVVPAAAVSCLAAARLQIVNDASNNKLWNMTLTNRDPDTTRVIKRVVINTSVRANPLLSVTRTSGPTFTTTLTPPHIATMNYTAAFPFNSASVFVVQVQKGSLNNMEGSTVSVFWGPASGPGIDPTPRVFTVPNANPSDTTLPAGC